MDVDKSLSWVGFLLYRRSVAPDELRSLARYRRSTFWTINSSGGFLLYERRKVLSGFCERQLPVTNRIIQLLIDLDHYPLDTKAIS